MVKLEWVNPHTWIHIEVVRDGKPEVWMVEDGTPNTPLHRGLTRDSLTVGTELVVDGYRPRTTPEARQRPRRHLHRRRKMFMGSSGAGAPRDGNDPTEAPIKKPGGR